MKRILMVLCVLVLAAGVSAQGVKPFNLYLGAGATLPMGDFGDGYGMGLHAKAGVGFNVAPMFQVVPTIEFHAFSPDDDFWKAVYDTPDFSGGNLRLLMFGADGRFSFGAPVAPAKPFVQAGIGFANSSISDIEGLTVQPEGSTDFYFSVGGGVDFKAGAVLNLFVLARYLSISTEGESSTAIPITVGLRF